MAHLPTPDHVEDAARRLPARVRDTPCVHSAWLSARARRDVWLKLESLQPTHSFKVRGAANVVARLGLDERTPTLVTASAGNHGAALAWAARHQASLTVFASRHIPHQKRRLIEEHGATLRAEAASYDEAERLARAWAGSTGARYISPYNDPDVVAGAGTVALEIARQVPGVSDVVVPIGGGGLAAGVGLALSRVAPECRVVAAEAAASPAFATALAAGHITPIDVRPTLADGLAGNLEPGSITFHLVRDHVHAIVTVEEVALARAVADLMRYEHLPAEGAGAIGVAAALSLPPREDAGPMVVIVTGSNIDLHTLCALVGC